MPGMYGVLTNALELQPHALNALFLCFCNLRNFYVFIRWTDMSYCRTVVQSTPQLPKIVIINILNFMVKTNGVLHTSIWLLFLKTSRLLFIRIYIHFIINVGLHGGLAVHPYQVIYVQFHITRLAGLILFCFTQMLNKSRTLSPCNYSSEGASSRSHPVIHIVQLHIQILMSPLTVQVILG